MQPSWIVNNSPPLKCYLFNLRSIINKLNHFHLFLIQHKPDLVFICESWLKHNKITNSCLINNQPYSLIRKDRPLKDAGGVLVFIKNNLHYVPIRNTVKETIAFDLFINNNIIRFILTYRPEDIKATDAFDEFSILFNTSTPFQPTNYILLGDLNLPKIVWSNFLPSAPAKGMIRINNKIKEFCEIFNLKQLVDFATRATNTTSNILDLIFTSSDKVINVSPASADIHSIFSTLDHTIVSFNIDYRISPEEERTSTYYDFINGDYDKFNHYLSTVPWTQILSHCSTAQDMFQFIKSNIYYCINDLKCIPKKTFSSSTKSICYPKSITKLKEKFLKLVTNPSQTCSTRYIGKKLFKAYKNFIAKSQKKQLSTQKALHKCLASITKTSYAPIPTLLSEGVPLFDDQLKADAFLQYFKSVYNVSETNISFTSNEPQAESLNEIIFNKCTVEKYMLTCSNKNMSGPDGIPGIVLKKCARILSIPYSILFNHIFQSCELPDSFYMSHVTPIPKIINPTTLSDYRPISGTSDCLKTLERCVKKSIMQHLNYFKLLPKQQFGFRPGRSTTKQMILFTELINKESYKNRTTDVIYVDLQKAFDKLTFENIMSALQYVKINGKLLNLIMLLLIHRQS